LDCVLGSRKTGIFRGIDGKEGMERVLIVVLFDVVAIKAFDVKETAMKQFELLPGMIRSLGEA
jgi:hypothetical protein